MNSVLISGEVLTTPKQICKYQVCQNKFFNLLTNSGVISIGIHNCLANNININDKILVNGTLKIFDNTVDFIDDSYKPNSFIYVDSCSVTPYIKPVNKLKVDAEIIKQTYISGRFSCMHLKIEDGKNGFFMPCQIDNSISYQKNVTIEGRLSPCMLDNNGNIEYIILANKIYKQKQILDSNEVINEK